MRLDNDLKPLLQGLNKNDFNIVSVDDEIRVDKRCVNLMRHFHQYLTCDKGLSPEQAGEICHGADYFLREFMIADRRDNLFCTSAERVRQFAGHWYIIRTPDALKRFGAADAAHPMPPEYTPSATTNWPKEFHMTCFFRTLPSVVDPVAAKVPTRPSWTVAM